MKVTLDVKDLNRMVRSSVMIEIEDDYLHPRAAADRIMKRINRVVKSYVERQKDPRPD
jgi:hypothetical protein